MAYEQKDNSGVAFTNQKKQNQTQPDFTGSVMIEGKTKDVSIWIKQSKTGTDYFTLAFRDKKVVEQTNDIP